MDSVEQAIAAMANRKMEHPYPQHIQDARTIAADGIVLLKNKNGVLPLQEKKVALYGAGASETIVCGTGSGYVMAPHTVSVREGRRMRESRSLPQSG